MLTRSLRPRWRSLLPHLSFRGEGPGAVDESNIRLNPGRGLGHALTAKLIWLVDRRRERNRARRAQRSARA